MQRELRQFTLLLFRLDPLLLFRPLSVGNSLQAFACHIQISIDFERVVFREELSKVLLYFVGVLILPSTQLRT